MTTKEQFIESLEKITLEVDPERLTMFIFKKDDWDMADKTTFANHVKYKFPTIHTLIVETESGTINISELTKEEKINLIKELLESL
jgi:hypothetical protein